MFYHNTGAYDPYGMTVPLNTQTHTVSNYDVPNFHTEIHMVFTNKMVVTPVRGAGRPYGVYVMERLLDAAARELGMDPVEIRRKNLMPVEQFPTRPASSGRILSKMCWTAVTTPETLNKALELIGYEKFVKKDSPNCARQGKTSRHWHGVLHRRHRGWPVRRRARDGGCATAR